MIRAKFYLWLGNRSERVAEYLCSHNRHILKPTELTMFFRVKEARCLQCGEEFDLDAGERPGMIPR